MGIRYNVNCGEPTGISQCAQCQNELVPGSKFCPECGGPVAEQNPTHTVGGIPIASEKIEESVKEIVVRANLLFESGDSEQAIQLLNKAIRIDPKSAYAYNSRGLAYYNTNRFNQATEDYDRAIHLDPEYADPYNNRGVVHGELARFEQAMQDFDKAIQLNPEYALAYSNRAEVYKELGQPERAQKDIEVVKTLDPELGDTHDTDSGPNYWIIGAGFLIGATIFYLGLKADMSPITGEVSVIDIFGPPSVMFLGVILFGGSGYLLLAALGQIDIFGDDD